MDSINSLKFFGHIEHLIDIAVKEDIGSGDITSEFLPDAQKVAVGRIIAKEPFVVAGLSIAKRVFEKLDKNIFFTALYADGDKANPFEVIAEVKAGLKTLLMGERTALNFLQRLSGIATHVRKHVEMIQGKSIRLVDTRKTIPGWRILEKYAVRVGGAYNHRMGLYDGVLIKDNHIAAYGGIKQAVNSIREHASHLMKIEIEASNLRQVQEALDSNVDVIMLDNMTIDKIKSAVQLIGGKAVIEVSGRIDKDDLALIAETGVNIISMGALTHSAVFVDISMKIASNPSESPR